MARASTIVMTSFPALLAVASLFFPKLLSKLGELMELRVAWPSINEWFAALVQLMSAPKRRLNSCEGSCSSISLDLDWFDSSAEFNRKMIFAVQVALSRSGKQSVKQGGPNARKRKGEDEDEDSDGMEVEVIKTKDRKAARKAKGKGGGKPKVQGGAKTKAKLALKLASDAESDDGADDDLDTIDEVVPKGGSQNADGRWKKAPSNAGAIIVAWSKQFKELPAADRPCWNHKFMAGGCKKTGCAFSH
jgi:hypothetical protein